MMKANQKTLSREIHPNIFRIPLPFPGKKPGPVNVYVFLGEKVTLLDTGIIRTVGVLEKALKEIGLRFTDIDQIIISHGHIDHYGAAKRIVHRSKGRALVASHGSDVRVIETGWDVPPKTIIRYLRLMGLPYIYRLCLRFLRMGFQTMADNCRVNQTLVDGEEITLGNYCGTIISTPGHSKGSVCIYLNDENILFSGDHILRHITPNALVMLDADSDLPKRLSQVEFADSLSKIEDLNPPIVYPAHGKRVAALQNTLSFYRKSFLERQDKILSLMDLKKDTVYHMARRLFPDLSGTYVLLGIYLAISEIYTHIQVHEQQDRVTTAIGNNRLMVSRIP